MSESIGYMLAQSYQLTAQTMSVTDDRGATVSRTVAAAWYRTFLCPAAGTGTETDPDELLGATEAALVATHWTVELLSTGLVRVTYLGTGTGTIDMSGCTTLRSLLGFTGNVGPLGTGATQTATYPPTHCVFALACDPDSGWIDAPRRAAVAALPSGITYSFDDGRNVLRRQASFRALPKTWALRTSLGACGTPAEAVSTRWLSPATSEPGQAPPWSAMDTQGTASGRQCAITWGDFATIVAGTVTSYEVVYLAPEQFSTGARVSLFAAGYDARRDFALDLIFYGAGVM